ncbi:hypothetical protein ZHAS_00007065 [Anopheles sinensis]|uniref:Uncharacterized protein n=1 Tax=Anopheles sinensis TaxID=74873 RepID=A0A084VNS9_ANOSI|nr:hypothetical protein ZHAS_00007065 [Anopheles sinensis]
MLFSNVLHQGLHIGLPLEVKVGDYNPQHLSGVKRELPEHRCFPSELKARNTVHPIGVGIGADRAASTEPGPGTREAAGDDL